MDKLILNLMNKYSSETSYGMRLGQLGSSSLGPFQVAGDPREFSSSMGYLVLSFAPIITILSKLLDRDVF